jgi:hypothetical protein
MIGLGQIHDGSRREYPAMNRVEMEQQRHNAEGKQDKIIEWYAQTKTGARTLGPVCSGPWQVVMDSFVRHVQLTVCPYCHGRGHNGNRYCPVCNGSGRMKPGNDKHWQQWQLDRMKAEAEEATAGLPSMLFWTG